MKIVSMVKMQERACAVSDLHELGRGIAVRMKPIIIKQRRIMLVDSSTFAGLINVSTSNGILISPTVICTKTNSCQIAIAFIK